MRSWLSIASACGECNCPSPEPNVANVLMNLPFLSNFMMRELFTPASPWPSLMKTSPLRAVTTPVGASKMSKPFWPAPWPALPSFRRIFPSGESLVTCMPLPFFAEILHRLAVGGEHQHGFARILLATVDDPEVVVSVDSQRVHRLPRARR